MHNLSNEELKDILAETKEKYKLAKENFEFMYASMLLEDIQYLEKELKERA